MNYKSKTLLYTFVIIGCVLFYSLVHAYHSSHMWILMAEQPAMDGKVVCHWQCSNFAEPHSTTNYGYGTCPYPMNAQ